MLKSFFKNLLFECTQFFFYTFTSKEKFLYKNNFNILRSLLVYGILTLIGIGLMFVMSKILVYFNVPFIKPDICNVSNNETNPIIYPWYYILIVGSILAPIFEEIAFRLPIIYRKNNLIFSILALYVSLVFINKTSAYKIFFELDFDYLLNRLIRLFNFNIIILCLILVSLILSISKQNKIIQNFWNRNTFIFYFCFCISFGLIKCPPLLGQVFIFC